ncbi:MAG: hypothetical protein PHH12_00095 [Candidatus Shapirobacteria bacterium]|nr:hypothetical protein [Candidatus Shapirobacteria bacterium]
MVDPVVLIILIIIETVFVIFLTREYILSQIKKYRIIKLKEMILRYKGKIVEMNEIKKQIKKCFFIVWENEKKNKILSSLKDLQEEFRLNFWFVVNNAEGSRYSIDQAIRRLQTLLIEENEEVKNEKRNLFSI